MAGKAWNDMTSSEKLEDLDRRIGALGGTMAGAIEQVENRVNASIMKLGAEVEALKKR
jgi:hypothetical protein